MERALQHIDEGEKLSGRLGGADSLVKEWFFGLRGAEQAGVLERYGELHGEKARSYAEETIPIWASGRRKMSGMVASRLFEMMPPFMPMTLRYDIVDRLWEAHGPRSEHTIYFGRGAATEQVVSEARRLLQSVVTDHEIRDDVRAQFSWLSGGDVHAEELLLNHWKQHASQQAGDRVDLELKTLASHLPNANEAGIDVGYRREPTARPFDSDAT